MTALQQIIYIITIKNYLQLKAKVYRKKISQKNRDGNKKNLDNSSQCVIMKMKGTMCNEIHLNQIS